MPSKYLLAPSRTLNRLASGRGWTKSTKKYLLSDFLDTLHENDESVGLRFFEFLRRAIEAEEITGGNNGE